MPELELLKELQALPLWRKIQITQTRISEFYMRMDGKCYISFSGGKDSTVLLHIARQIYPDIPAVYCDTGLEYPEIKEFVKTQADVTWIKPEKPFNQVIKEYGWCYPSKDTAQAIYYARRGGGWAINKINGLDVNGIESSYRKRYLKWKYLLDAPFVISHKCCDVMKEKPFKKYEKQTKSSPIIGIMATESQRRKDAWKQTGCNAFNSQRPNSKPMSFWTEQDVLMYLKHYNIQYCSIYGDILEDNKGKLHMTGAQRTGCMFCPTGCHLDQGENRYQRLKKTHPQIWEYCMKPWDEGGLGLGEFLDFVGVQKE